MPVTSQAAATDGQTLSRRTYYRLLTVVVLAVFGFRSALGARGSFTGDDFEFRAATAGGFPWSAMFTPHNGHLNPVGLVAQWAVQQVFPGRYVPLMILSAALVAGAAALVAVWAASVFGYRYSGLIAAGFLGLVLLELELATWWSVALYAAPLLAASALLLWATTRHVLGTAGLWAPLGAFALALLCSTKAVLLPVLIGSMVAAYPLGTSEPPGFKGALSRYRRLWASMVGVLVVYGGLLLVTGTQTATGTPTARQVGDFVSLLLTRAALPAFWGGPWEWVSLGFHAAPAPSALLRTVALLLTGLAAIIALRLRPRVWRMLLGATTYVLLSATLVGLGRAGSAFSGPMLRYTFDFALPVILVAALAASPTRWETRSSIGSASVSRLRWLTAGLVLAWLASATVSYVVPWRILPGVTMKPWVDNVRSQYSQISGGLLAQPAPREVALFATPLATFLTGDPGAPQEVRLVTDRLLGFDGQGYLIDQDVAGIDAVAPTAECQYQAVAGRPALVPLTSAVNQGEHTIAFDYLLSTSTPVAVSMGETPTAGMLPAGAHRSFAVVAGGGEVIEFRADNPDASLCILRATVGWIEPGPRVDPASTR